MHAGVPEGQLPSGDIPLRANCPQRDFALFMLGVKQNALPTFNVGLSFGRMGCPRPPSVCHNSLWMWPKPGTQCFMSGLEGCHDICVSLSGQLLCAYGSDKRVQYNLSTPRSAHGRLEESLLVRDHHWLLSWQLAALSGVKDDTCRAASNGANLAKQAQGPATCQKNL